MREKVQTISLIVREKIFLLFKTHLRSCRLDCQFCTHEHIDRPSTSFISCFSLSIHLHIWSQKWFFACLNILLFGRALPISRVVRVHKKLQKKRKVRSRKGERKRNIACTRKGWLFLIVCLLCEFTHFVERTRQQSKVQKSLEATWAVLPEFRGGDGKRMVGHSINCNSTFLHDPNKCVEFWNVQQILSYELRSE